MGIFSIFAVLSIVGAAIGYVTKWTSVQLIFHPSTYVGIGPLGWQGVVQRGSPKFARGIAETLRSVAPLDRMLARIDSSELARIATEELGAHIDDIAPEIVEHLSPGAWDQAPVHVQDLLRSGLRQQTTEAIAEIVDETRTLLPGLVDVDGLALDLLSGENADRLARLVRLTGNRELRAVVRYGAVVGFFVGLLEAVAYLGFDRWWLLPAIGALDGLVNNWMGIQMIFRPLEARRYLGLFRYQGLFPARQDQIAHDYAHMMGAEVLTPMSIVTRLREDDLLEPVLEVGYDIVDRRLDAQLTVLAPVLGVDPVPELRQTVVKATVAAATTRGISVNDMPRVLAYLDERMRVADTIENGLASMSKRDFEGILRGIFEEDEPVLIGIGGVIGVLIGCLQAALVVGLHLG